MSLATQGSVIKPKYQNSFLNSLQQKTSLSTPPPAPAPVQGPQPLKVQTGSGINQTVQKDAAGNTYAAPKSNKNILAQQQALNKLGAGLVEDGIAGDKTRAAIAQFGTKPGTTPGMIKPDYDTKTGMLTADGKAKGLPEVNAPKVEKPKVETPPASTPPAVDPNSAAGRTSGVLNTGQFTPTEQRIVSGENPYGQASQQAIQGLLDSNARNQVYADRANQIATNAGNQISNIGRAGARGQAGYLTTGTSPVGEGNAAVLAQTTAAQQQAVSQGANMELAGNAQGLSAQGQAQSGLSSAAGNALSGQGQQIGLAQNQAGRAQGAASTVFGAGLVSPTQQGQAEFSPLGGYQGGNANMFGDPNDPATGQAVQNYNSLYSQYNEGTAKLAQAQGLENQIASTILNNPDINNQPLSFLTKLNEFASGQLGSAPQQLLAQQVNNYIKAIGLDTASAVDIATQQKGTLKQILQSLKTTATNNNNALKTTADGLKNNSTSSSGGTTGGYAEAW